jgi:hypothetical protein
MAATQIDDAYLVGSISKHMPHSLLESPLKWFIVNWRVTLEVNNTCTAFENGNVTWVATGACELVRPSSG